MAIRFSYALTCHQISDDNYVCGTNYLIYCKGRYEKPGVRWCAHKITLVLMFYKIYYITYLNKTHNNFRFFVIYFKISVLGSETNLHNILLPSSYWLFLDDAGL